MSKDLRIIKNLRQVCDYLDVCERKDFYEKGEPTDHIYNHVKIIEEHCRFLENELNSIEQKTIEDFL